MSVADLQRALAARERQIFELTQRLEISESMNETLAAALRDKNLVRSVPTHAAHASRCLPTARHRCTCAQAELEVHKSLVHHVTTLSNHEDEMTALRDCRDRWASERQSMSGELQSLRYAKLMHRTDLKQARVAERRKCAVELQEWGAKGVPGSSKAIREERRVEEYRAQIEWLLRENLRLRSGGTDHGTRPLPHVSPSTPPRSPGGVRAW